MSNYIELVCYDCGGEVVNSIQAEVHYCTQCNTVEGDCFELTEDLWNAIQEVASLLDSRKKYQAMQLLSQEFHIPTDILDILIKEA